MSEARHGDSRLPMSGKSHAALELTLAHAASAHGQWPRGKATHPLEATRDALGLADAATEEEGEADA